MFGTGLYNPYITSSYYQAANMAGLGKMGTGISSIAKGGLTKGLLGKFSFSGFLNGASKTLNVVNQAIPIFYQVKPMINNAKTMFRVMGAVKDDTSNSTSIDKVNSINTNIQEKVENNKKVSNTSSENPTFFI